ncbi:hypothetical protein EIN_155390 [Entamoeba invadens IP1]|uniref:Uncharacterized protein n=1 Tax=Entamoeba invadens IP1 TaxID=370355 RepID=A0A0A1U9B7_ENTIV|nr:hypothetical protein EIN_155390 [Entamoeba invadens IP1]ELP91432.1 hypothetical protein EIN_155390 [Entamoeba invadens IP1]|eukprot:XP_004258203.1 hypothetical protein EIN_155390 [Entamoeba invadens IP1]
MTQRITELHTKLLEKQKNTKDLNYKNDWKTTLFSSQFLKAPQLFVMKDSSFINTLSQNVASKVKRRIYIRVVEDELNESNLRGDGVYEKTLNVVFKKEGNAFVGRHRRDVCEFVYYTGEPKPESQGVIFIECDLPKEKQKEEYIAVIKSVDWETRKIQIISNNKKEHENFRRYNAVRSVVESEMIRLMARNAPGVFLSLKSDDVLMNEKIDNEISENWSEQIVMGKCFDREFMVKMDTLCKDKTYVGYQEEYERMVERENKKSKEKMDNPDVIVKLLENESNDQNDTAQKVEKIEQKSEKTESGENEEQNEENAEGFNAFLDLTQFI